MMIFLQKRRLLAPIDLKNQKFAFQVTRGAYILHAMRVIRGASFRSSQERTNFHFQVRFGSYLEIYTFNFDQTNFSPNFKASPIQPWSQILIPIGLRLPKACAKGRDFEQKAVAAGVGGRRPQGTLHQQRFF